MWKKLHGAIAERGIRGAAAVAFQRLSWMLGRPVVAARSRAILRRLAVGDGSLRLIVGAGAQRREGWVSTDIGPGAPVYLDISRRLPLPDASVDRIFGEQVIEHLPRKLARRFLRECGRVLKSGGVLRLATPDMEAIVRGYLTHDTRLEVGAERTRRKFLAFWDETYGEGATPADLVNYFFGAHGHRYLYDFPTLRDLMVAGGLRDVRRVEYGTSGTADLCGMEEHYSAEELPTMGPLTLVVEGCR